MSTISTGLLSVVTAASMGTIARRMEREIRRAALCATGLCEAAYFRRRFRTVT